METPGAGNGAAFAQRKTFHPRRHREGKGDDETEIRDRRDHTRLTILQRQQQRVDDKENDQAGQARVYKLDTSHPNATFT